MNNTPCCVWKGGVGTKQGLFHGLLFSRGAGSPLPWNSEVECMGANKNRKTELYRNTPSPLRGSRYIHHCSPNPTKILDSKLNQNQLEFCTCKKVF